MAGLFASLLGPAPSKQEVRRYLPLSCFLISAAESRVNNPLGMRVCAGRSLTAGPGTGVAPARGEPPPATESLALAPQLWDPAGFLQIKM